MAYMSLSALPLTLFFLLQYAVVPGQSDAVNENSTVNLLSRWKRASTGGMKEVTLAVNFASPLSNEAERNATTIVIKKHLNADILSRWPSSSPVIDVLSIYRRKCKLSVRLTYSDHSECDAMKAHFDGLTVLSGYSVGVLKNDECPTAPTSGSASSGAATSCNGPGRDEAFLCSNGNCVSMVTLCDGFDDCGDNSDEDPIMCSCRPHHLCDNRTRCVSEYDVCDGVDHCSDGSDEQGCGCPVGQRSCLGGKMGAPCVSLTDVCDVKRDCPADQDEAPQLCGCRSNEFKCDLFRECIPTFQTCDGRPDCQDGSDEDNCVSCTAGEFRCGNLCLPPSALCNGIAECPGGEDEINCTLFCAANEFQCAGLCLPLAVRCNNTAECPDEADEKNCTAGGCNSNQFFCDNVCFPDIIRCNNRAECRDGTDEANCTGHCEPHEFQCSNGQCVRQTWRCDYDDDCGDGSDEANCGLSKPGDVCSPRHFTCHDGRSCIERSLQCDEDPDCSDGSDELGCAAPTITKPPPFQMTTPLYSTFDITCQATGVPPPVFVWRFNNRHLPPHCIAIDYDGSSNLHCLRVTRSHQGTYSCEAHNSQGVTVADPSTTLTVE